MTANELREIIRECCNDVIFTYDNKESGVTSTVRDYIPTFQVWHGDDHKYYSDVDELMTDKFYSGKSLDELVEIVEIWVL